MTDNHQARIDAVRQLLRFQNYVLRLYRNSVVILFPQEVPLQDVQGAVSTNPLFRHITVIYHANAIEIRRPSCYYCYKPRDEHVLPGEHCLFASTTYSEGQRDLVRTFRR
ncbi:MAG: hypothetical protein H0U59_04150 [Gemmatimonadaceae bacterium]|nr:hypothetical protein [Gemmatimonadaceae bacterium]